MAGEESHGPTRLLNGSVHDSGAGVDDRQVMRCDPRRLEAGPPLLSHCTFR